MPPSTARTERRSFSVPHPSPTGTSIKADQVGITHIGLWVHGLDAVYEDLKRKGVRFVVPPHTLIKTPTGEVRSAFSLDPDGMLIQLDEIVEDKA